MTGSLLLNYQRRSRSLVAVAAFGEHLTRRSAIAALLVIAGAAVVGREPGTLRADWLGVVAIVAAVISHGPSTTA